MKNDLHQSKVKNGAVAAVSAFCMLLAMSLNIGGLDNFFSILFGLGLVFIAISLVSFVIGLFLSKFRVIWSIVAGSITGLMGGLVIVYHIISGI